MKRWIRIVLAVLAAVIGVSAVAGGIALIAGVPGAVPSAAYLAGSPFSSYAVPGVILAVVVGGTHIAASVLVAGGRAAGPLAAAIAGFGMLIWIFVQLMYIPFDLLHAIYFAAGLAELGLVLLGLGVLAPGRAEGRP